MKKITLLIAILIATATKINAQWQQTIGSAGNEVYSIATDGTNIFAALNDGILLSTNKGT